MSCEALDDCYIWWALWCLDVMRKIFEKGAVSRESVSSTFTAYNNSCAEKRSEARGPKNAKWLALVVWRCALRLSSTKKISSLITLLYVGKGGRLQWQWFYFTVLYDVYVVFQRPQQVEPTILGLCGAIEISKDVINYTKYHHTEVDSRYSKYEIRIINFVPFHI